MKRGKSRIIIVLRLSAAFLDAHIGKNNLLYDKNVDNSQYIPTGAVAKIEQTFVGQEETLDGFRAKCQVIGDVTGMKVKYSLLNMESGEKEAQGTADAEKIKNGRFYYFKFDTVKNCKGNKYKVIFENESVDESKGIGFSFQPETETGTGLTIKGVNTTGTMIVKVVTERFDLETFIVLLVFILYVAVFIKFLYRLFK